MEEKKKMITNKEYLKVCHLTTERFKAIRDIADTYLGRGYPDAPDPDVYMTHIEDEVKLYWKEIDEFYGEK